MLNSEDIKYNEKSVVFPLDVTGNYLINIARFLQFQYLYIHGMAQFTVRRENKAIVLWIDIFFQMSGAIPWASSPAITKGSNPANPMRIVLIWWDSDISLIYCDFLNRGKTKLWPPKILNVFLEKAGKYLL